MRKHNSKGLVSIMLVVSIIAGMISMFSFGASAAEVVPTENWGASADGIFYISSAEDLLAFCHNETTNNSYAGKIVKLTDDIDCTGLSFAGYGTDTANTRRVLNTFKGTLDGCGYAIKNLTLGVAGNGAVAFANVLSGATVKNIKFLNYSSPATNGNISVVAVETEGTCVLENIYTECSATGSTGANKNVATAMIGYIGRLDAARTKAYVTISNCVASGSLTAYARAAGFVGRAYTGSLVMNDCVWMGKSITATLGQQTASLVGYLDPECPTTLNRCLNIGATYKDAGSIMDIASNANLTLNDVYTVLETEQSSARFANAAATPTVKITYGGVTAYEKTAVASTEVSNINAAIRTLAVKESKIYTQETFNDTCPALANNWTVVESETVTYSSGLTITKILPKTIAAMLGYYSPIDVAGVQEKLLADSKSLRIVGVVNFERLSEYEEVGFAVTVKKNNEIIVAEKILTDDTQSFF
ncbi:MAG: hypothetical protein IKJ00_08535, partial [Clostridia bacterium]|nr:hypothetical protein [Clostridia bacterium]